MASWWSCKYPGCNKKVWSPIQQVSCEEHRGQMPETANTAPTKFASELEIEELEIENKFLREQLAELQAELEDGRRSLASEQDAYRRLADAYQSLTESAREGLKSMKVTVQRPAPIDVRYSASSPTGRSPDGTVWYTKSGHTVWSPGGVI